MAEIKAKMYLIMDVFPGERGEATFILPELPYLLDKYELTVISTAQIGSEEKNKAANKYSDKFSTIFIDFREFGKIKKTLYSIRALFSKVFWQEAVNILKTRKMLTGRLKDSLYFYISAIYFYRQLSAIEPIDYNRDTLFYNYWYNNKTMACCKFFWGREHIKVITRAHGYDLYEEQSPVLWQPFKWYMDGRLDGAYFVSKQGQDYYNKLLGHISAKQYVSYLGVRRARHLNPANSTDTFELLSCSAVIPLKRVDRIAKALRELDKDVKLHWIHFGEGDELETIRDMAEDDFSNGNVSYTFYGQVTNEEVIKHYQDEPVDLFITTSSNEGLPVSIMEAISYGIPVVATDVGGIKEIINGNGILLSDDPSISEISSAIMSIYRLDEKDREYMRNRSYEIWEQSFDNDKNAKKFLSELPL